MLHETTPRQRPDRCPGVTRPWVADDGALVRVRLVAGLLGVEALASLVALSAAHGDGDLHLTKRANVQIRAVPYVYEKLPDGFVDVVRDAGLLPSTSHELVRNVMVSPLSGRIGGRADLRSVAHDLDRLLLGDPACATLAGRFLFTLDDGRGDLVGRTSDLTAVALDDRTVQVRAGSDQWGPVVAVDATARALHTLTKRFLDLRGDGPTAAWHVDELSRPLLSDGRDDRSRVTSKRPSYGRHPQDDGRVAEHVDVPDGVLSPDLAAEVLAGAGTEVVVTPWRSLLLPDLEAW